MLGSYKLLWKDYRRHHTKENENYARLLLKESCQTPFPLRILAGTRNRKSVEFVSASLWQSLSRSDLLHQMVHEAL